MALLKPVMTKMAPPPKLPKEQWELAQERVGKASVVVRRTGTLQSKLAEDIPTYRANIEATVKQLGGNTPELQ